jgi:hypothetical protein
VNLLLSGAKAFCLPFLAILRGVGAAECLSPARTIYTFTDPADSGPSWRAGSLIVQAGIDVLMTLSPSRQHCSCRRAIRILIRRLSKGD